MFVVATAAQAEMRDFVREYTYVAGDADSRISSRQMAMQEVKTELLEEIGTHIYSRMDITEDAGGVKTAKREVRALTSGFVRLEVLKEVWDGYTFYLKARLSADPDEVVMGIKKLAIQENENADLRGQLIKVNLELERISGEMLTLKKAMAVSKTEIESKELANRFTEKSKEYSVVELLYKGVKSYLGNGYAGTGPDYPAAFKWYREAANRGHPEAQLLLGSMYGNGEGVEQDYKKAFEWYLKGALQGHDASMFVLALAYTKGLGVKQDDLLAEAWIIKAAKLGNHMAQYNLAGMYRTGEGVAQDFKKAVKWYTAAADQGSARAQGALAIMYGTGDGVEQDYQKTLIWNIKAAYGGNETAQFNLAIMYGAGLGTDKSMMMAAYWFEKAANQGDMEAQYHLGVLYFDGAGVEQDDSLAEYWYRKAAAQGHEKSIYALEVLDNL